MNLHASALNHPVVYRDPAFEQLIVSLAHGTTLREPTLLHFSGMPKAQLARAARDVAARLRRPLFDVDLAGLVSRYIGETEKNLGRLFASAQASGAVLLLDEADALMGRRTNVQDAHDRFAAAPAPSPLELMERYRVLAIVIDDAPVRPAPHLRRRVRHHPVHFRP